MYRPTPFSPTISVVRANGIELNAAKLMAGTEVKIRAA
jgi:hypothetical protein